MDEMDVPQAKRQSFYTALYQFLFPLVGFRADGTPSRLSDPSLVSNIDTKIFQDLDSPPPLDTAESLSNSMDQLKRLQNVNSRYKDVGPVKRLDVSASPTQTEP